VNREKEGDKLCCDLKELGWDVMRGLVKW